MAALLRAVRTQHGMTLDDLAAATGLTKSYLSKVERGHSTPSIAAALKIARALDVDVARLFSDDVATTSIAVDRAATAGPNRHQPIAADMLGKAMSPFVVRPGRQFAGHPHPAHPGQEFLFVHAGEIELSYGDEVLTLTTGDSAYIDASVAHKFRQVGDDPAAVVVVAHDGPRETRGARR
jgi:transcriptional regulator with XRE-family HTH domain